MAEPAYRDPGSLNNFRYARYTSLKGETIMHRYGGTCLECFADLEEDEVVYVQETYHLDVDVVYCESCVRDVKYIPSPEAVSILD